MEVPVINRIGDFEAGINTWQSPSFLSQLLSISGIDRISRVYSFWKWGALILAILASFSAIINRIKILIIRFQREASSASNPLLRPLLEDSELDDSCSSSDSDEDDYDEDEEPAREVVSSTTDDRRRVDDVFFVKGSGFNGNFIENHWQQSRSSNLRRRRSIGEHLSEFASGKSVVKLWENLGLGLGFELDGASSSGTFFLGTIETRRVNFSLPSAALQPATGIVSSAANSSPAAFLRLWDARASTKKPAILAEWGTHVGNVDGVGCGGIAKVYLRDGSELAAVGDLRKASAPLNEVTGSDVETWWDADAVIVGRDGSSGNGMDSAMTRCCDAVRSYLFF